MSSTLPKKSYARIPVNIDLPNLIEVQLDSFERLKKEGLGDLFHEVSPIESYNKGMKLYFPSRRPESKQWGLKYWFGEPKHNIEECVERDLTYASPMYVSVLLAGPDVPEPIKQDIFLGDFPEMTDKGTFIINGTERVVVSQLIRSPGVYFEAPTDRATGTPAGHVQADPRPRRLDGVRNPQIRLHHPEVQPQTHRADHGLPARPRRRGRRHERFQARERLDEEMICPSLRMWTTTPSACSSHPRSNRNRNGISAGQTIAEAALIEFFKKMRPGDPATLENARQFLEEQLFDQRHYDLERVGRYKLNQKLDLNIPIPHRTVTKNDVIRLIRRMIQINNGSRNRMISITSATAASRRWAS
jgi:DNA-directed RNA polymerase subunit beta